MPLFQLSIRKVSVCVDYLVSFKRNNQTIKKNWPPLFKKRMTLIQRINCYPADKMYPLASFRLFVDPADEVIHIKVGRITFFMHWIMCLKTDMAVQTINHLVE